MTLDIRESLSIKLSNASNLKRFEKLPYIPYRYFVIFLIFLVAAISFAVRNVINFAILAMVNEEPLPTEGINSTVIRDEIKFNWDQRDQGFVLGAYFYTYTAVQIVSGVLTDKFNAVHLLTASQVIAAICSFLCPICAEYGMIYLIAARMVLGLAHGIMFPSCFILMERWLAPAEIAFAQSCVQVGSNFGIVVVMPLTAWLCDIGFLGGWPSAFYMVAAANIVFIVIWFCTITLDPSTNRWVSSAEKELIARNNDIKIAKTKIPNTPWIKILTSIPLWSVTLSRGLNGLVYYAINAKIPVYLEMVLGYKLKGNGLINSLFYVAICSTQLFSGPASRYVISKKWLSKTITRKVFESIALLGTGLCLLVIPSLGNRPNAVVAVIFLCMFFNGFTVGGDTPIIPEMAPHLVGTVFGFANTLGCAAGFISPVIIASILGDQVQSQELWNRTFYVFAGLITIALLSFVCFATTKPQAWGKIDNVNEKFNEKQKELTKGSDEKQVYDLSSKV